MVLFASFVASSERASDAMQITLFMNILSGFSAVERSFVETENLVCTKSMSLLLASATMVWSAELNERRMQFGSSSQKVRMSIGIGCLGATSRPPTRVLQTALGQRRRPREHCGASVRHSDSRRAVFSPKKGPRRPLNVIFVEPSLRRFLFEMMQRAMK